LPYGYLRSVQNHLLHIILMSNYLHVADFHRTPTRTSRAENKQSFLLDACTLSIPSTHTPVQVSHYPVMKRHHHPELILSPNSNDSPRWFRFPLLRREYPHVHVPCVSVLPAVALLERQHVSLCVFPLGGYGVCTREARVTIGVRLIAQKFVKAVQGEVGEGVGANEFPGLLDGQLE
jgi:hypothetical protein